VKKLKFWGAACIFAIILMRPQEAVTAAQRAMGVWCVSVAPTLFPFLVLMPLLTNEDACTAYEAMFSKCMRVLFGLSGAAAPAVVVGMIAGSPAGAIALRRIAANSNIKPGEARRIALAVSGVSPAYLIMGVGQGLYGSRTLGMKLAGIQLCIQLLLLVLLPRGKQEDADVTCLAEEKENRNPISMAVEGLLGICGYMVFFSTVAGVAASFAGEKIGGGLLLALDLPSGLANLASMQISAKMVLLGASVGFGGLCIACQNMDILKDIGLCWKNYLKIRCITASLFACAGVMLEGLFVREASELFENCMKSYAGALLIVGFMVVPGLFLLSKKLFLNNQKYRGDQA